MRSKLFLYAALAFLLSLGNVALADHGHGHGKGHGRDRYRYAYDDHDRDEMREYYRGHRHHLPPGLAKRDHLPPGLERRLRVHYVLAEDFRPYMRPCPEELEERLPPPPPHCAHTVIGGHVVLMNSSTHMVLDVFHFE